MSELESVRIHFCPFWKKLESVRIGKSQNRKVSELESVILTLSNFEEKCILILTNSDTFQSLFEST